MKTFKIIRPSYRNCILGGFRYFHNKSESVVIAAAARTPWGKYQGQLSTVSAWHLGQLAVEAAVKQSAIPIEQIEQIFMNEMPVVEEANESEFVFSTFLKKAKYTAIRECSDSKTASLLKAFEFLKCHKKSAVVVAGLQSTTQNESLKNDHAKFFNEHSLDIVEGYLARSATRYSKSQREALFDSELIPLTVQQCNGNVRCLKEVTEDEFFVENWKTMQSGDGAVALVLTTFANAVELKLSPLAVILDFEYLHNSSNIIYHSTACLTKLLSKTQLNVHRIQHWEIEDSSPQLVDDITHNFNLDINLINPHGSSLIFGNSSATSLARLSTHLAHSLKPQDYGCVICCNTDESFAFIMQKLPLSSLSQRLPLVTLYTKDPCPLCDTIVEEMEHYFAGEYELEKIFIDTKDNLRFLRLYRYDIPVVFLNNQFLCMHRLNHRLFRKRLDVLSK